jgi:hypothetical protein
MIIIYNKKSPKALMAGDLGGWGSGYAVKLTNIIIFPILLLIFTTIFEMFYVLLFIKSN